MYQRITGCGVVVCCLLAGSVRADLPPGEAGVDQAWLSTVQQEITDSEYRVSGQPGDDPQAPNRAHGFRTFFRSGEIEVLPRRAETGLWRFGLGLESFGRSGSAQPVGAADRQIDGNRVTFRFAGIDEWYVNDARGLKHGFTIEHRPQAPDDGPWVELQLRMRGDLSPRLSPDGLAIGFDSPSGEPVLHYGGLYVHDDEGRQLPARMTISAGANRRRITLQVDDRRARYPITIDPLLTAPSWTTLGGQASAWLGASVGTAGDVNGDGFSDVIVGAPAYDGGEPNEGVAFVYHGSASGPSTVADWSREADQVGANYGVAVATAGDVNGDGFSDVIVSANLYDVAPGFFINNGRVFVYLGSASGLPPAGTSWSKTGAVDEQIGASVACAGDVNGDGFSDVLIGVPTYESTGLQTNEGRAMLYRGSSSGLEATPTWDVESNKGNAEFGRSLGTAGDVNGDGFSDVIVGAPGYANPQVGEGRVFVYYGSGSGLPTVWDWSTEIDQNDARLGEAVGTAGDVNADGYSDVIVGAPLFDNGHSEEGLAQLHLGSSSGLLANAAWSVEGEQDGAQMGGSVATAGDVDGDDFADVIVGAPLFDNGHTDEGRATAYTGQPSGLSSTPVWSAESDQNDARLGEALATAGDVNGDGFSDVVIGTRLFDGSLTDEGRATIHIGAADGLGELTVLTDATEELFGAQFGVAVDAAGDVNGDGFGDVIVGAPFYDGGFQDEGKAFVYHGTDGGLRMTAAWSATGGVDDALFGFAVSGAGDFDGDGFDGVLVGAPGYTDAFTSEGRAVAYDGSLFGLLGAAVWSVEGGQASAALGHSVDWAGDVNGDGFSDVIIGAPQSSNGEASEGRAFVHHGSPSGLTAGAQWTGEGNQVSANYGVSVAGAGDVNGDGFSDVIVGADLYDSVPGLTADNGRANVYLGSPTGLPAAGVNWWWAGGPDEQAASSVATAGDVNGDGYADVIVGSQRYTNGTFHNEEGRSLVFHGSSVGVSSPASWEIESNQGNANYGASVGTAGDVNGDGYADAIVGAPGYSGEGRAFVYHGSGAGLSTTEAWFANINAINATLGVAVASAGDVNADGYADVVVGIPFLGGDTDQQGSIGLALGNDTGGLSLVPRQRRADDSAPIAQLGAGDDPSGFRLAAIGRTPFGRGRVKLESEVKVLGTAFDLIGIQSATSWSDSGLPGTALNEPATGAADTVHHWRVRAAFDPVTTPLATAGRWLTVPRNGWQEADLRLPAAPAGRVPDGQAVAGAPLLLDRAGGGQLQLSWDDSCRTSDTDFAIYEGPIGTFTDHERVVCSTGGATTLPINPSSGDRYYLVVPTNSSREGSYGTDSAGTPRSPSTINPCLAQLVAACP